MIATPAFGGQITTGYAISLISTLFRLNELGHETHVHMQGGESLISRGRNLCATDALTGGFDKLLFIDADMTFTPERVEMLLNSKRDIVGGTYPLKSFPVTINFNPLVEQRDLFGPHRQQDNYMEWVAKYADENGEAEVMHIPTGFMLIDCKVLAKLTYIVPNYGQFHPDKKTTAHYYDFFPVGTRFGEYESEDWAFCRVARENGFGVYLQTRAVNGHIGTHEYNLGQHVIIGQQPLIKPGDQSSAPCDLKPSEEV